MARPPEASRPARSARRLPDELVDDLVDAGSREHYADAALYDYEYRRRRADVTFYRELARRRGADRILELGAGSGRVTLPLARDGRHVVAVDRSPEMLARLRDRVARLAPAAAARVTPVLGDLRTFSVGGRFPLVIAAFNVLEHLYTRGEFHACLQRIAAHLAPGGAFAFDVQLPDLAWLLRDPTKRWAKTRFTDPTTGRAMYYSTNHDYDPVSQIALIRLYYEPADEPPAPAAGLVAAAPSARRGEGAPAHRGEAGLVAAGPGHRGEAGLVAAGPATRRGEGARRDVAPAAGAPGHRRHASVVEPAPPAPRGKRARPDAASAAGLVDEEALARRGKRARLEVAPLVGTDAKARREDPTPLVGADAKARREGPAPLVGGVRVVKLSQRKFFPAELEALVAHAGFRVAERYGDFSFAPLDGSAESQVLVCERVEKRPRKRPVSR